MDVCLRLPPDRPARIQQVLLAFPSEATDGHAGLEANNRPADRAPGLPENGSVQKRQVRFATWEVSNLRVQARERFLGDGKTGSQAWGFDTK